MHANSERGVAAHWRYKEGGRGDQAYERKINQLRTLLAPAEGGRQPARLPRPHARRSVPGPGLRAVAQGRDRRRAGGRHPARLRLPGAHGPRAPDARREGQRPHGGARIIVSRTARRWRSSPPRRRSPRATGCRRSPASSPVRATATRCAPGSASRTRPRTAPRAARCWSANCSAWAWTRPPHARTAGGAQAAERGGAARSHGPRRDQRRAGRGRDPAAAARREARTDPPPRPRPPAAHPEVEVQGIGDLLSIVRPLLQAGAAGADRRLHHGGPRGEHPRPQGARISRASARSPPRASWP